MASSTAGAAQARLDEMRQKLEQMRGISSARSELYGGGGSVTQQQQQQQQVGVGGVGRQQTAGEIECVLEWRGLDELALTGETTADGVQPSSFRQSPRGRDAASVATLTWDAALSGDYKVWVSTVERRVAGSAATAFEATLYVAGEEPRTFSAQADPAADVLIFDFSVHRDDAAGAPAASPPYSRLSLEAEEEEEVVADDARSAQIVVDEDVSYVRPLEATSGAARVVRRASRSPVRRAVLVGQRDSLEEGEYSRRPRYVAHSTRGRGRRDTQERPESPSPRRRVSPSRRESPRRSVSPRRSASPSFSRRRDDEVVDVIAVRGRERVVSPRRSRRELSPWRHGREIVDRSSRVHRGDSHSSWERSRVRSSEGFDVAACCSVDVVDEDGLVDRVPLLCGQPGDSDRPTGRTVSPDRSRDVYRAGSRSPGRRADGSAQREWNDTEPAVAEGRLTETREARIQRQLDSRTNQNEGNSSRRQAQAQPQSWFSACMSADDGGGGSWWDSQSDTLASPRSTARPAATRRLKPRGRTKAGTEGLACLSP